MDAGLVRRCGCYGIWRNNNEILVKQLRNIGDITFSFLSYSSTLIISYVLLIQNQHCFLMNFVLTLPPRDFLSLVLRFLLLKRQVKLKADEIHILQIKNLGLEEGHPLDWI